MFKNAYFYRARLFPALLTSIPMLIFINKIVAVRYHAALSNIFEILPIISYLGLSAAIIFLCVQINRLIAKEIFQRLYFKEESHMPTTNNLLWNNNIYDDNTKAKIRDKIYDKFGVTLLKRQDEQKDEIKARKLIVTSVSQIKIALTKNVMLLQHNIEYGFWRNLIGGCLLAVIFSACIYFYGRNFGLNALETIGIILFIIYMVPIILSKFIIGRYGRYYSKILYEQFLSL